MTQVNADLPCRLIVVVGMPSGGGGTVAGTLTKNGFWNKGENQPTFRSELPVNVCSDMFSKPYRKLGPKDLYTFARWARTYKQEALDKGFDKAVQVECGHPVWMPELFQQNILNVKVEPLLVWRNPESCAASIKDRFPKTAHANEIAKHGQDEILRLHETYGWPMWRFGKEAKTEELEKLLGVPLPERHFDASVVRH